MSKMIRSRLARDKANSILKMYRIVQPPVDVVNISNLLGFKVVPFPFPDTISATIQIEGPKKVIGLNQKQPETRQRFSIAHELGHYLSGHENFSHEHEMFVDRDKKYLDPQHREEEEADEFAAELLMPEFMLRKDVLENKLDVPTLAGKYNVSEQAMWIQLINLRLAAEQAKAK